MCGTHQYLSVCRFIFLLSTLTNSKKVFRRENFFTQLKSLIILRNIIIFLLKVSWSKPFKIKSLRKFYLNFPQLRGERKIYRRMNIDTPHTQGVNWFKNFWIKANNKIFLNFWLFPDVPNQKDHERDTGAVLSEENF